MADYGRYGIEAAPEVEDPTRRAFNATLGRYPSPAPGQPDSWKTMQQSESAEGKGLVDPLPGAVEMAAKYSSGVGPAWLKAIGAIPTGESAEYKGAPVTDTGLTLRGPQAERNATKIAEMMRKMIPAGTTPTEAEQAIMYMRAKYPLLTSKLVGRIGTTDEIPFRGGKPGVPTSENLSGQHQLDVINHGTEANPEWGSTNRITVKQGRGDYDAVGTLGHELTHAIQNARWKRSPVKPQFTEDLVRSVGNVEGTPAGTPIRVPQRSMSGPGFARTTNPLGPFVGTEEMPSQYRRANDLYGYTNNPFETQAQEGGATAQDTMRNFAKAYKPAAQITGYVAPAAPTTSIRTPDGAINWDEVRRRADLRR